MKYKFKDREEMLGMYNSISTPHSHSIAIEGNNLNIEWDGDAPESWNQYCEEVKVKSKKSKKK